MDERLPDLPRGWTVLELCQYRGRSVSSRLIRCFNWGDYSHSALRVPDTGVVYESWQQCGCVKAASLSENHTPGTVVDLYQIALTFEQRDIWLRWMDSTVGAKYDWRGILGFVLRRDVDHGGKYFCSEWVLAGNLYSASRTHMAPVRLLAEWTKPERVFPSMLSYSPVVMRAGSEVTV